MPDKEIVVKMVVTEPPVPEPNTLYLICPATGPSIILLNGLRMEQGSWQTLVGKPAVIAAGETATAARETIQAGAESATITDSAEDKSLVAAGNWGLWSLLQSIRNYLKWVSGRFDANGKALTAASADSATSATNATTATNATKLATARSLHVNLASSSAVNFDGTANVTPGVTGALGVANGGTGSTSVAAARTALGVPAAANGAHTGTTTMDLVSLKAVRSKSTNQGSNATINMSLGEHFTLTPVGNFTLSITSPPPSDQIGVFILDITNGGSYTISWPANSRWEGGTIQTLTATGRDRLAFTTVDGGTSYEISMLLKNFK